MNLNDSTLQNIASNVALSIQVILSPQSSPEERRKATIFCENFRSTSSPSELASVGFILISKFQQNQTATDAGTYLTSCQFALSGFQFIDEVIKFNWSKLDEREVVKQNLLNLMQPDSGFANNESLPYFLSEGIAKTITEVAKLEWPQVWPNLFPTLFLLMSTSELPLQILRRLAEDVITLRMVASVNRRRDLTQSLNVTAEEVLSTLYKELTNSLAQFQVSRTTKLVRRIKIILETLLPYIEWSKLSYFLSEKRIPILFVLLESPDFRMEAAACIIQFLEKTVNKKDDRHYITNECLKAESFDHFLNAVTVCKVGDDEALRKLGDILKGICSCSAVGNMDIKTLMSGLTLMANRPEAFAVLSCTVGINSFLRHVSAENTALLQEHLIQLLNMIVTKYISVPPGSAEKTEMLQLKSELCQMLRKVGQLFPFPMYSIISAWLNNCILNPSCVQAFQWDTLILVLGTVQSFVSHENEDLLKVGLRDLEVCFTKFTLETDLKTKSFLLSTVSAEFVFLSLLLKRNIFTEQQTKLTNSILEGIFNCLLYEREVWGEIRHHAASLMVKLSSDFPELLSPAFDIIFATTVKIFPTLSTFEYQNLAEAMILISNSWNDVTRQSTLIQSLVNHDEWKAISLASKDLPCLVKMFQDENVFIREKDLFLRNLNVCHAILKRVKLRNQCTSTIHPAYHHFLLVIPAVLEFTKAIHSLVELPELKFGLEYDDSEMSQILGISNFAIVSDLPDRQKPDTRYTFREKIKNFFRAAIDSAYGILRLSSSLFSPHIYSMPQIGEMFLLYVGGNAKSLDDYRLSNIVRHVLKQFLLSCPVSHADSIVKHFLRNFLPFLLERLQRRWAKLGNAIVEEDTGQIREVLENASLRLLTKEYFELLVRLLEHSKGHDSSSLLVTENGMDTEDGLKEQDRTGKANSHGLSSSWKLSCGEVGVVLLQDQVCSKVIYQSCLMSFSWEDSQVHLKAIRCLLLSWDAIAKVPDIVHAVLIECLRGLTALKDHETNAALHKLTDKICVGCLGTDPVVSMIFIEWGAPANSLDTLLKHCQSVKNERERKDILRKMIESNSRFEQKKVDTKWLEQLPQLVIFNPMKSVDHSVNVNLNEYSSGIHS